MHRNFKLKSECNLIGYEWRIDRPAAIVCLIHGIGEHAGRYDRVGEVMKESGIAMISMDLRGHGLSQGKRGHTSPRMSILKDIDLLIEYGQREYPDIPLFLYGHSMGGNIALDYRRRGTFRSAPAGYIITAPWLMLQRKIPGYLYWISEVIARVKPDFQMNSKIDQSVLGNANIISKLDEKHLVHGKITVMTALEGLRIAEAFINNNLEPIGDEPLKPMLLMQGDADKICNPEGARILAQLEKGFCDYIEWNGLYHEIHNGGPSSDGMEVIRAMIDWMKKI